MLRDAIGSSGEVKILSSEYQRFDIIYLAAGNAHWFYSSDGTDLVVDVKIPMAVNLAYPVPYVPPGVTQPASNATTTNGCWFSLPDGSELWSALDGEPDGVELVVNATDREFSSDNLFWSRGVGVTIENGVCNFATAYSTLSANLLTVGQRYKIIYEVKGISGGGNVKCFSGANLGLTRTAPGVYSDIITAASTSISFNASTVPASIDNISVQRIQPQPITLATRVRMGVGSGDLPNSSVLNILAPDDVAGRLLTVQKDGSGVLTASLNDGTNTATVPLAAWARGAVLDFFPQVLTSATQMRVGYRVSSAAEITWGTAATYDGSFGPDAVLLRLMNGYVNAYPQWFSKITAWKQQVSDDVLLGAWG